MSDYISGRLFSTYFRPAIRVFFEWDRFQAENWPVRVFVIDDFAELTRWYTPWNGSAAGEIVRYDAANAQPIRLGDTAAYFAKFDQQRQATITALAKMLAASSRPRRPVQLVAPAYRLPGNLGIFLDGNHRLAALLKAQVAFQLLVFLIEGPLDNWVMPELRHWETSPTIRNWE